MTGIAKEEAMNAVLAAPPAATDALDAAAAEVANPAMMVPAVATPVVEAVRARFDCPSPPTPLLTSLACHAPLAMWLR
jgi:hypothetical protein